MHSSVSSAHGFNQVSLTNDDQDESSDESYTECDDDNCSASSQESVVAPPYSPMDYDDDGHDNYYDNDDNNDDDDDDDDVDDDVDDMDGLKVSCSWSFLYALCVFFTF